MNKIFLLILCFITFVTLIAVEQSEVNARIVAGNFAQSKVQNTYITENYQIEENDRIVAYVYNLEPEGFIAISSDSDIYPVIAYSFRNRLYTEDGNLIYRMIKTDLQKRMEYSSVDQEGAVPNQQIWRNFLNNEIGSRDFLQYPPSGSTPTDGWVETQWNQSGVFNDFCPLDNSGERSVVGCVATAMAMIIDFHGYAGNVSFDNSDDYYSGNGGHIDNDSEDRDFPSFSELNVYLEDMIQHYENNEMLTPDDLAALNFACGISVEMWYSSGGSGAYTSNVANALLDKFDFDSATWIENENQSFYTQMANEMMNMRPTELSIYTSGWNNGHAIICDGYNTDDYYHLNYGWGTSNSTCWYLLPQGMPSNYSIIGGAVMNIEGGAIPVNTQGNVNVADTSPVGTHILLEGPRSYECFVTETNGDFEILAVEEGTYQATATLNDGRTYYESLEITIDENNHFITFNLGNFDAVSGVVNAPINSENCHIYFYQDGDVVHTGITNSSGQYSIPNVLPGDYHVSASLGGNYFEDKDVTITLENQVVDFDLEDYEGEILLSYAKDATDVFTLIANYTLTCGIKFPASDLTDHISDVFSKIRLKAPINSADGEIYAQIWNDNDLLSQKQVTDFSYGEWIEVILDNYIPIEEGKDYYIGYLITSETSDFAFHDAGPRVDDKGAFFRTSGWNELPLAFNFNFCIEASPVSMDFAVITGTLDLQGGDGEVSHSVIQAADFTAHPDENGNFMLFVKEGNYAINAYLQNYSQEILSEITIENGDVLNDMNLVLNYSPVSSEEEELILSFNALKGNYPNPFFANTKIQFSISQDTKKAKINIYNIKGQSIKEYSVSNNQNSIFWDGTDKNHKRVESGIYFYKLDIDNKTVDLRKMILINK